MGQGDASLTDLSASLSHLHGVQGLTHGGGWKGLVEVKWVMARERGEG